MPSKLRIVSLFTAECLARSRRQASVLKIASVALSIALGAGCGAV